MDEDDQNLAKKAMLNFRLFRHLVETADITDKYDIGSTLGSGAFGEVKTCTNKLSGLQCAIKIINKVEIAKHPVTIQLMAQELTVL